MLTSHLQRNNVVVNVFITRKGCPNGRGMRVVAQCGNIVYDRHCNGHDAWACLNWVVEQMAYRLSRDEKSIKRFHIPLANLQKRARWMELVPSQPPNTPDKRKLVILDPKQLTRIKNHLVF